MVDKFEILLGEDMAHQPVLWDLDVQPHTLIGGSSGSGKTELTKLAAMQCIKKGADVFILDMKGSIDFLADFWRDNCIIVLGKADISRKLSELAEEVERRFPLFIAAKCNTLGAYNQKMSGLGELPLKRYVIFADEVSQLLDKTALCKDEKAVIDAISSSFQTIYRMGRSVGVNCWLASQRPSAEYIAGDIRSNADLKIVGRCDETLSEIILGNRDAAKRIPKKAQGRFLTNDGTLFRAYLFDDKADMFRR